MVEWDLVFLRVLEGDDLSRTPPPDLSVKTTGHELFDMRANEFLKCP